MTVSIESSASSAAASSAASSSASLGSLAAHVPVDVRSLLTRVNRFLVARRRALAHDHCDTAFWDALGYSPARAQRERRCIRSLANVLHVERATRRGRLHGTQFATLDEQRAWLESVAHRHFETASLVLALVPCPTLAMLRAGKVFAMQEVA